jgi:predicted transcriptional regulator of viral defense system
VKYYAELLKLGLFTKEDINQLAGNQDTAKSILRSAMHNGYVERIRHNYYAVKSLETGQPIANRFAIGSMVNSSAYISHHTAFEYYGMANQVFSTVYISSTSKFKDFLHDGVEYKYLTSKQNFGIIKLASHVKVTDIERTILDGIKDFIKIGGLEELLRCLSMVTVADEVKLLSYLAEYKNQFLCQKAGYILSHYKNIKLSQAFFSACKQMIGKSKRYLYDGVQFESSKYYSEWQLFAPYDLMKLLDEGGEAIV